MTPGRVLVLLMVLFPASEIALAIMRRARADRARLADRGSPRVLVVTITLAVIAAAIVRAWGPARMALPFEILAGAAIALILCGLAIRWSAIFALGRFFTVNVAIHRGHLLVQKGPYRFVRHPSYTGLLVIFLGFGVATGNWLGLALLMAPATAAVLHRIGVEEAALRDAFGADYEAYCARTKRLVPWLY